MTFDQIRLMWETRELQARVAKALPSAAARPSVAVSAPALPSGRVLCHLDGCARDFAVQCEECQMPTCRYHVRVCKECELEFCKSCSKAYSKVCAAKAEADAKEAVAAAKTAKEK